MPGSQIQYNKQLAARVKSYTNGAYKNAALSVMPASRPLYLYKSHSGDCVVHSLQKINAAAKKFYKACDCFVWITGTTTKGEFVPRQSTGLRDWDAAEAYLASINKQVVAEIVHGDQGMTLEAATKEFLDGHKAKVGEKAHG
jgi:hypothetical protein